MVTPEGGGDPLAGKWVPVPLEDKVYDRDAKSYKIVMVLPARVALIDNFEAMVHDELLRNAHKDGLDIEGQILITTESTDAKTVAPDPTEARDAEVRDVLLHPEKEADVEAEQDKFPGMSQAERDFRKRMRGNLRETADEAFGFVSRNMDGTDIGETGKKFRVDRNAFMDGFFGGGGPAAAAQKVGMIRITAEAIVGLDLGLGGDDEPTSQIETSNDLIDRMINDVEIPDDLSELDDDE